MAESKVLEEYGRRAIHERSAEAFSTTHHVDETTLMQRLQHAADCDAANLFDFRSTDRLAIRDDRQRLEGGSRETLRTRGELRTLDRFGVLRSRENLPTAGDLLQLDPMTVDVIVFAQFVDGGGECRRRFIGR